MNTTFKGLIFLVIGISILLYVFIKERKIKILMILEDLLQVLDLQLLEYI